MLEDDFMAELLDETVHFAGRPGWVEFKGDLMVMQIQEKYGLDEPGAETQLNAWLASRDGGSLRKTHDAGLPRGSKMRTAGSTSHYLVVFLSEAAVRTASPRLAAKLWPE